MHFHTLEETTAISDDLVLEGLGYKLGKTICITLNICIKNTELQ